MWKLRDNSITLSRDTDLSRSRDEVVLFPSSSTPFIAPSGSGNPISVLANRPNTNRITGGVGGPLVSVTKLADAAENGASGTFQFTRTGNLSQPLTVNVTVGGSATSGADYVALPATVTFAANSATATLTVTPKSDNEFEDADDDNEVIDPETVVVTVVSGTGYLPSGSAATVSVTDDPPVVTTSVSWSPNSVTGELGTITVTRSGGDLTQPLTAWVEVSGELELEGEDVIPMMAMTVEFGANETSVTIDAVIDLVGPGDGSVPSVLLNGAATQPLRTDQSGDLTATMTGQTGDGLAFGLKVSKLGGPLTFQEFTLFKSLTRKTQQELATLFGSGVDATIAMAAVNAKLAQIGGRVDWRTIPIAAGAGVVGGVAVQGAFPIAPAGWQAHGQMVDGTIAQLNAPLFADRDAAKNKLQSLLQSHIARGNFVRAVQVYQKLKSAAANDPEETVRTLAASIVQQFENGPMLGAYDQLKIDLLNSLIPGLYGSYYP